MPFNATPAAANLSAAYPAGNEVDVAVGVIDLLSAAYPAGNYSMAGRSAPLILSAAYPAGNVNRLT